MQKFIVCRELRRNIILGVDFAKHNCAGIQWMTKQNKGFVIEWNQGCWSWRRRIGDSCYGIISCQNSSEAVFEVNIHAETEETHVIKGNKHLLERHPNMYQHEIAMMSEEKSRKFPLLAITNLDHVKTLHLAKGEVVGFAIPESSEVTYIATTNYKQQRIQRFFSKFACPEQLFKGKGRRQVESAAKCDTWIFYANNGKSDAIAGPRIHSMVR